MSFKTVKQITIVFSSTEEEYMSMSTLSKLLTRKRALLAEIDAAEMRQTRFYQENMGVVD